MGASAYVPLEVRKPDRDTVGPLGSDVLPEEISAPAGGLSSVVNGSLGLHVRLAKRLGLVLETGAIVLGPVHPIRIVGEDLGNTSHVSWLSSLGLVT